MSKRTLTIGAVLVAVLLAVGGLYASNMGFKLNYRLAASGDTVPGGTSLNGTNSLGLPFNRQTGIATAQNLYNDIGSANVLNIQRYLQSNNGIELYSGTGTGFNLATAEGYFVRMSSGAGQDYIVVGSHDPSYAVALAGTGQAVPGGTSANGTNFFAYPYHSTAANAGALCNDIGSANTLNIQRYLESNGGIEIHTCGGGAGFNLVPGEAYFVKMTSGVTVNYTPSHY